MSALFQCRTWEVFDNLERAAAGTAETVAVGGRAARAGTFLLGRVIDLRPGRADIDVLLTAETDAILRHVVVGLGLLLGGLHLAAQDAADDAGHKERDADHQNHAENAGAVVRVVADVQRFALFGVEVESVGAERNECLRRVRVVAVRELRHDGVLDLADTVIGERGHTAAIGDSDVFPGADRQ